MSVCVAASILVTLGPPSLLVAMSSLDELRPALADVLGRLLDPAQGQRELAEQQLKALQVTEGNKWLCAFSATRPISLAWI